jgi:23S rRNA (uracil1939-C5)-methyltransferase
VRDQLARIGGIDDPPVQPTLPSPSPWGYRNRVTFGVSENRELGFQRRRSHEIEPIYECFITDPRLMALYESLDLDLPELHRLTLMAGTDQDDLLIAFETKGDELPSLNVDFPVSCVHLENAEEAIPVNLIGRNHVTHAVGEYSYRVSAGRFFQVNTGVAAGLVELVLAYLDPSPNDTIVDAYAGVGLFTLPLADRAGLVIAIELDPGATEDLLINLGEVQNVEVVEGPVEAVLPDLVDTEPLQGLVVDPPRQGLDVAAIDALVADGPSHLVYVSCDPATLARDLKRLARGGYTPDMVQPVDMFPQTFHVETITRLRR